MVNISRIKEAEQRLASIVHKTPLMSCQSISDMGAGQIWLKCENMQKTGSFKVRGAYNCAAQLTEQQRQAGLVTGSSGNHGTAVAYAAKMLGCKAVIVMPEDASPAKVRACQAYGGTVIHCGFTTTERLAKANELVAEGMTLVHPYDDPEVVAGQGTVGLEILQQLPEVDLVFVPVGGGGLLAGVATAIKESGCKAKVIGVEPALSPRLRLAWNLGEPTEIENWQPSIADGIRSKKSGKIGFTQSKKYVDDLVTVDEEEIRNATRLVIERAKIWCEPSAAVTVAAYLGNPQLVSGKKVVCLLSGGNIEISTLAAIIGG